MYVSHSRHGTRYGVYKVSDYINPDVYVFQGGPVPKPVLRVYDRLRDLYRHSDTLGIATLYREFGSDSVWWRIELQIGTRRVAYVQFANDTEEFYVRKNIRKDSNAYTYAVTRATFNRKTREWFK